MRDSTLAKRFAEFRMTIAPRGLDKFRNINELTKYYLALMRAGQVEAVIGQPDRNNQAMLVATCEIWLVYTKDIALIRNHRVPKDISSGDIVFIANATIDKKFNPVGIYWYFRKLLKMKYPLCKYVFWYNADHNRISRVFKVQRFKNG